MSTAVIEPSELMIVTSLSALQLFAPGAPDRILDKIKTDARSAASSLDASSDSGRKAIASLAYKVARTKTFLDDQGKELGADYKKKAGAIDAERKKFRDELDALKDEVRAPLTEFENAEKLRIAAHEDALRELEAAGPYSLQNWQTLSAEAMGDRLNEIDSDQRNWQEFAMRAAGVKALARNQIVEAIHKREKYDAEQAELVRLRAEAAERERKEREERIAREATEAAERAAKIEQEKADREARERELTIQREKEAAEKREREATERIERMRVEAEQAEARRKQEAIDAERRATEAAEAATRAERDRAERTRLAAEEESRKREANKKHRAKIEGEAANAIASLGLSVEQSDILIAAIAAGKVPHVRIEY